MNDDDDSAIVPSTPERRPLASAALIPQEDLGRQKYLRGDFWLGRTLGQKSFGWNDEVNLLTCAGPGAGKGTSTVIPNLLNFPGSAFVIDPKGELAGATAHYRKEILGHKVIVLDPARIADVLEDVRGTYNPLDALNEADPSVATFAQTIAEGIVVPNPHDKEPYWADNAIDFIQSCILYILATKGKNRDLMRLRQLVGMGDLEHYNKVADLKEAEGEKEFVRSNKDAFPMFLGEMLKIDQFNGIVQETAAKLLSLGDKGRGDILGTARTHLDFMKSADLHTVLGSNLNATKTFTLDEFRNQDRPLTVYLCLPVDMIPRQGRWFRIMLLQIVQYLQRTEKAFESKEHLPILMMIDEFFQLGPIPSIVNTLTFSRSAGVRLWLIVQDLNQVKANYPDTWETILGACGIKQFFGVNDMFTAKYISELIGEEEIKVATISTTKSVSAAETETIARSISESLSITKGTSFQTSHGTTDSITASEGFSFTEGEGSGQSTGTTQNSSSGGGSGNSATYKYYRGLFGLFAGYSNSPESGGSSSNTHWSQGRGTSQNFNTSVNTSKGKQSGKAHAKGTTTSTSSAVNNAETTGQTTGKTESEGITSTKSISYGVSVAPQKRPLIRPEEVLTAFTQSNQHQLVHIRDFGGLILRRTKFYNDPYLVKKLNVYKAAMLKKYGEE